MEGELSREEVEAEGGEDGEEDGEEEQADKEAGDGAAGEGGVARGRIRGGEAGLQDDCVEGEAQGRQGPR